MCGESSAALGKKKKAQAPLTGTSVARSMPRPSSLAGTTPAANVYCNDVPSSTISSFKQFSPLFFMVALRDQGIDVRTHPGRTFLLACVVVASVVSGCRRAPVALPWASSMAVSSDGKLIYATDPDNDLVVVLKARTEAKVAQIKVGRDPERIVLDADGHLYVSNRGGRSVSVIHRGDWREAKRIPVGLEPVGLAVSPDKRFLYVVNSTSLEDPEKGTLVAIDLRDLHQKWSLTIGPEPREIRLLSEHRASVLLRKEHTVLEVDLENPRVLSRRVLLTSR